MAQQDAIALLDADHQKVEQLFQRFRGGGDRQQLAQTICHELAVHAQIEEEVFYPAVRRASGDNELIDHSRQEHDQMRGLINQLEGRAPNDELMQQLEDVVMQHVREEREQTFPAARRAQGLDLMQLGQQLEQRKSELMAHA